MARASSGLNCPIPIGIQEMRPLSSGYNMMRNLEKNCAKYHGPMVVFQISKQPQPHSTSAPFSSLRILRSIAFDPSGPLDVGQPLLRRWETHGWKSLQNAGDDDKLGDSYMG